MKPAPTTGSPTRSCRPHSSLYRDGTRRQWRPSCTKCRRTTKRPSSPSCRDPSLKPCRFFSSISTSWTWTSSGRFASITIAKRPSNNACPAWPITIHPSPWSERAKIKTANFFCLITRKEWCNMCLNRHHPAIWGSRKETWHILFNPLGDKHEQSNRRIFSEDIFK